MNVKFWELFKVSQLGKRDGGLDIYNNFSKVDITITSNVFFSVAVGIV